MPETSLKHPPRRTLCLPAHLLLLAMTFQGCSPASVKLAKPEPELQTTPDVHSKLIAEPLDSEAVIVINNNSAGGNHAGIFAGTRLNDPAGSYVNIRSEDKSWPGPGLADYIEFQKADGENVQIYRFKLKPQDFSALNERMASAEQTAPLFCAAEVQNLIAGLGPFSTIESVGWTSPSSLAELLDNLTHGHAALGVCVMPDNHPCLPRQFSQ